MCGLFKWKRICAIFILFVYIWIGIGDPVIRVGGLDPIDWFNLTTFLCLSQCYMYMGLGSFLCSVICGEISIKFRSQVSDYSIMKDSNLMSRMFYYNMLKMYVVMIKILLNFSQNWTQSLSLLLCIWIRGCKGLCSSLL